MKRELRLTKTAQFATVYNHGKSWANDLLVVKAFPNGSQLNRFGFSVNKRVGKAVVRNLIKRRLRSCVESLFWETGWDLVFVARSTTAQASYSKLNRAVEQLNRRARLKEIE